MGGRGVKSVNYASSEEEKPTMSLGWSRASKKCKRRKRDALTRDGVRVLGDSLARREGKDSAKAEPRSSACNWMKKKRGSRKNTANRRERLGPWRGKRTSESSVKKGGGEDGNADPESRSIRRSGGVMEKFRSLLRQGSAFFKKASGRKQKRLEG